MNSRDSERTRNRAGSVGSERICSGDVSEALTEVPHEETRLPRESSLKEVDGKKTASPPSSNSPTGFSHVKDCPITEDPDSVAHLVRHFKSAGCPLPSLRNMTEHDAYVKMAVAHAKAMEANNEFAATLEKCLKDANATQLAAAEKLWNQTASFEARLRVIGNERKSALEQVSYLEAKIQSSADKHAEDLRRATYEAKKVLAIMNNNLLAADELSRLREKEIELGAELDVAAVSDFSVGKLDLPQASEDIPEEFFGKVPDDGDGFDHRDDRVDDGEFDAEG
ncbi:hypothetical protein Bca4012_010028 [Brassica carinata]